VDPLSLRDVVEAVLDIPHCQTPAGRDEVLLLLPRDVSGTVQRMSTARMDTLSIVSTCARYPGGLTDLVEAIRFYANGSITMARLDAVVAALPEDPDRIW
jgi:Effector-associated domain 2